MWFPFHTYLGCFQPKTFLHKGAHWLFFDTIRHYETLWDTMRNLWDTSMLHYWILYPWPTVVLQAVFEFRAAYTTLHGPWHTVFSYVT